ncbi:hypothetical protein SH528x_004477 [Novipirellula sp. SH528]|uniref:hypothetical protein n=1 Tax=Novipirellula sp. SH528 TaxID=3454466 RepID=UPI003F9EF8C5
MDELNATNPYEPTSLDRDESLSTSSRYAFGILTSTVVIAAYAFRGIVGLQLVVMLPAVCMTLLPIAVVMMIRRRVTMDRIGQLIIAAGTLLVVHVALTAATVELLLRQSFVLDLIPYNRVISFTMNYVVPGTLLGFTIASLSQSSESKRFVWTGGFVVAIGSIAAIAHGYYFFATLLGDDFASRVWWA